MSKNLLIRQKGNNVYAYKSKTEVIGKFILNDGAKSVAISIANLLNELEKELLEDLNIILN